MIAKPAMLLCIIELKTDGFFENPTDGPQAP
jgi:hypothetical protein